MGLYDGKSPVPDVVDVTERKHGGNPESEAANLAAAENKSKFRKVIFDWFLGNGPAIAEDCLAAFPGLRYSTVTARISELRRDGMLVKIGTRATKYSGKQAALLAPWGHT